MPSRSHGSTRPAHAADTRSRTWRAARSRAWTRPLAVLLTGAVLLAGCSRGDDETLVVYSGRNENLVADVFSAFTTATGIEVEVIALGDAGSALNRVILTADDPEGDVLFGIDSTFLTRALAADLFLPHRAEGLDQVDAAFVPADDRVTPIDFADVCVNYDVAWFAQRGLAIPSDLEELADPAYAGLLAVQNPATSSPGLAFLLATIERFGEDGAFAFWTRLRANDVLVTEGWSDAYYGAFTHAGGGDRPLVVSYASSPAAEVHFADGPTDVAPTGIVLDTCFRQVEYVGILAASPRTDDAKLLVDFLLSPAFQADLPVTMWVHPVRPDVPLPDVFVLHAQLPPSPITMAPQRIDEGRDGWIGRFTETVLR
jgi:thiamine transport system substrate-binding protein